MTRRILCLLLAAVLLTAVFSGCKKKTVSSISYPVAEDVRTFYPQYTASSTARTVLVNCFDPLVSLDRDGNVVPAAASSWTKTGNTYTFSLRTDAVWTVPSAVTSHFEGALPDGYAPPVTAQDFVFAFQRLADPALNAPSAYLFDAIEYFSAARAGLVSTLAIGVHAVDAYTLTITTDADDDFLKTLAHPAAAPCNEEFFELCGGRYGLGLAYMLFNGPYTLSRWDNASQFRMSRNEGYTGAREPLTDTVWLYLNDDAQRMNEKLARGVYSAGVTTAAAFDPDGIEKGYTATSIHNLLYALVFNCKTGVTAEPKLRKALTLSVDPTIFEGGASAYLPLCARQTLPEAVELPTPQPQNDEAAKSALKEALAALNADSAELTVLCAETHETMLKQQMQHWQKALGVSISIKISALPDKDLLKTVAAGNFEAAYCPLRVSGNDWAELPACFVSGAQNNFSGFSSETYDLLFGGYSSAKTKQSRTDALRDLLNVLRTDFVYLPLADGDTWFLRNATAADVYYVGDTSRVYFVK